MAESADVLVKPVRKLQVAAGFPKVCGSPFAFVPLAGHHRILFHLGIDESSLCNGLLNATPFGTFKIQFRQFISVAHLSIVMCQQQRRWFEALWGKMMGKSDSYAWLCYCKPLESLNYLAGAALVSLCCNMNLPACGFRFSFGMRRLELY